MTVTVTVTVTVKGEQVGRHGPGAEVLAAEILGDPGQGGADDRPAGHREEHAAEDGGQEESAAGPGFRPHT
ncbi:hypothetical protein [Streptomyces sp. NPDC088182]|uniref:hypothetical protein n=1 Tax=Streptomyces sp. NPDC088182 TaxID=3365838 RepID=UPI00380ECB93